MRSGVIYYEYEKCKKFEDFDMKANAELGTFKIRRDHFDYEYFVHHLHCTPNTALLSEGGIVDPASVFIFDGCAKEMKRKKEIGGMEPSVEKKEASEKNPEEEEDPEEEVYASPSLSMDIDASEDYLQIIEELERRPEYSLIRSGHASVPDSPI
ncbi:hypothetical protein PIB30_036339 [Stylosanthes scabra]|uniref:Uncharacterized protein n=1 Tax=Stylosanthes scabra TaxID=79078 RepID=A0ABU6VDF8_9FABA|nr:hypothetical protein [Stylosanthes scabra]